MKTEKLGDICSISIGRTPSRNDPRYWGDGFSWLSIADMKNGKFLSETKEQVTDVAVKECKMKSIPKGTLLFSFKLSLGKVGIAGKDLYTNEAIAALPIIDKEKVYKEFLFHALRALDFGSSGDRAVKGVTLNKAKLNNLQIPLPPLPEQKHIAAILDKADALRQKNKQLLAAYDELLQSVFLDMFGDPVTNPKGWDITTIEKIAKKDKWSIKRGPFGGALKKEIFVDDGYLVYEQYHALNNDFSFERYYIDEAKFRVLKAFEVRAGDIIISCSGVYLGKLAIVPKGAKKGVINQALLKVSIDEMKMRNVFFVYHFAFESFKAKYFASNRGAGIPNFPPMTDFKKFPFICPPIELQNKFAQIVENIETQKALVKQSLQESEDLFNGLVQKAFKGELV